MMLRVSPNALACARFPLKTTVLFPPMLLAKVLESEFQSAEVVDREITQLPEFMLVAPLLNCVLKNSRLVMVPPGPSGIGVEPQRLAKIARKTQGTAQGHSALRFFSACRQQRVVARGAASRSLPLRVEPRRPMP